jgi:hypothetical protein
MPSATVDLDGEFDAREREIKAPLAGWVKDVLAAEVPSGLGGDPLQGSVEALLGQADGFAAASRGLALGALARGVLRLELRHGHAFHRPIHPHVRAVFGPYNVCSHAAVNV